MPKIKLSEDQKFYGKDYAKGEIVNFSENAAKELKPKGKVQKEIKEK